MGMIDPLVRLYPNDSELFRRTRIPRTRAEIEAVGGQIALEAMDMIDAQVRIYPNASDAHCPGCAYRTPCLAMVAGLDPTPVLESAYRRRAPTARGRRPGSVPGWSGAPRSRAPEAGKRSSDAPPGRNRIDARTAAGVAFSDVRRGLIAMHSHGGPPAARGTLGSRFP